MAKSFEKIFFLYGLIVILSTSSMVCQTKFKLFAEKNLGNYKLLHFSKDQDSIVIISEKLISTKKIENNVAEIVAGKIGKKTSHLNIDGQIYWFYYKMKSQKGLINSGEFKPGEAKKTIYTYRSLPFYIEKFN